MRVLALIRVAAGINTKILITVLNGNYLFSWKVTSFATILV